MDGMIILCLVTLALSMIGLVIIVGCMLIGTVSLFQEKIIRKYFPNKYYYDYDEEI